jgi:hypothetical protein
VQDSMCELTHPATPADAVMQEFQQLIFSQPECDDIVRRLLDLEAFWLPRHAHFPFYTMGATHYYDITANPDRPYQRLARQYNPFLLDNFGDVYGALLTALQGRLGQPVAFLADAALPGFHIFGAHPAFVLSPEHDIAHGDWFQRRHGNDFPGSPIHLDTAHLTIGLPTEGAGAPRATRSFTLAVCLPRDGAGMKLWELGFEDIGNLSGDAQMQRLRHSPSRQVNYGAGELFVHGGDHYHQARGLPVHGDDYRITLQGHAALLEDTWRLFW